MKQISKDAAWHLMNHIPFKKSNTRVEVHSSASFMYLFGNLIAIYHLNPRRLILSKGISYLTSTTKSRLNALPNVHVRTIKGQGMINDILWPEGDSTVTILLD